MWILNGGVLAFVERGKPENPEKNFQPGPHLIIWLGIGGFQKLATFTSSSFEQDV